MPRASPRAPAPGGRCRRAASTSRRTRHRRALRELDEETGIRSVEIIAESPGWYTYDLPAELRPKAWGGRYRGQRQKWFAARFTGADDEIALVRPGHTPGVRSAWRWAGIDELVGLIVPFKRAVYEQVVRDFARSRSAAALTVVTPPCDAISRAAQGLT